MVKSSGVLVLLAAVAGCATHSPLAMVAADLRQSGVITDPKQVSQLERALTDSDIANLLDAGVRAKLPTAVAVARLETAGTGCQPALATIDAEELAGWTKAVQQQRLITGVHPVSPLVHKESRPTLHSLRVAAARMNCELLLVYLQADSSVDNYNDAAALYWTLLGLWLVPGNVCEHRTVMQAVLADCRTGMILGTATGDAHRQQAYPLAFQDTQQRALAKQAAAEALTDVQEAFGRQIGQVVASAVSQNR
ncbi:MAG: hypothetical protein AMJ81_04170 [Phycisphaerae bacterium SM23_33]|nr:MAG: hypothetical protein AMJ81_04170 [Phycisphaerae bacterium SM23_33]